MFDISTVTLDNFRSFKGHHTWVLPQDPGLCFLTGRNDDNSLLIRNGAGKSTLLESIVWCLYDKTSRGLKATDIVTWGCKKASVTVELCINATWYKITRTRNPNVLTVNGVVCDTVVNLIRLSYEEFLYSVIFSQFNDTFFDLSSANKLALFSKIMKLDIWLELSQQAADEAKGIELKKNNLSFDISRLEGRQITINESIEILKEKALNWDADKQRNLKAYQQGTDSYLLELARLDTSVKDICNKLKPLDYKIEELNKRIDKAASELLPMEEVYQELLDESIKSQCEIDNLNRILEQLSGLDAKCPTCWQKVDEVHLVTEKAKLEAQISNLKKNQSEIDTDRHQVDKNTYDLSKNLENYSASIRSTTEVKEVNERKLRSLETEIRQVEFELKKLKEHFEKEKSSKNEYQGMLEDKIAELGKSQDDIQLNQDKIHKLNEQYEAVNYWVSGFKKLRLLVIEETLRSLEIEINNSLESLGLVNWKVQFDIERENKSGGVTKGFVVFIQPPNQESVRWEAYSGGETQLLRLAGALGLSNLIMERAGLNNLLEIYDEPSSHVSNVNALVQTLHNRANSLGKKVILVDHSAIEYPFDSEVLVVKDENGSRIEV
jgi:DNA repair exonuclease SbcCD ATPase subunit